MKFVIKKPKENIHNAMRQINYHFQNEDKEKQEMSFVKPVGLRDFPRFHIYLKIDEKSDNITFNLHLDQKSAVYKKSVAVAHSADYEGITVEKEAERIKIIISSL